ncbi:hypothetical protein CC77DRAFT_1064503 [Alternaria alternata]|uniref:CFEM domain-containing protein n=2 Tax=Alternaria alternata complex TaxID=187734 RepID=A0A177DCL6_ALTAL|nr:hypothetical protein CC77DRAFT_1064503 [Alternaria alternata]XP_051586265.1 uncharacterized protein J4E82_007734 [Alternaria postmessia]RII22859.1 hypothetical protein CUC08_Gglean013298 [Alternaria sp. MG1]RYN26264.1 hypothetical protein AA0115_g7164 [Alternaria tenuissima]KAH6862771.1 hypothetical protein B0T12DRAFT_481418 [Alternaria alternata]KAI5373562.1 hypothetical protein J4E82_007734 [Alternaria postmessia]OAG17246.1 hypothetical protein CC77DRAFT_1064503 [Alternaria alternata]
MRFSIIAAVAAFSSTALAQGLLDQIPQCAQQCFGGNLGSCGVADIACICGSSVINDVSCCVFATCSQADIQTTTNFAVQLCNLQNVDVNTQPSCPSGSATPSAGNSSSASMTSSGSASMTSSGSASMTSSGSAASGSTSMTASASAAGSTGAAPYQTAGAGIGLGVAMVGLLAAL